MIDWASMPIEEHAEELRRGLESRDAKIALLMSPTTQQADPLPPARGRGRPAERLPAAPPGALDGQS